MMPKEKRKVGAALRERNPVVFKATAMAVAAANGALYFFPAVEGANNIPWFSVPAVGVDICSGLAGLVYSAFMYKTLMDFSVTTSNKWLLAQALLAAFPGAAFFSAGYHGGSLFTSETGALCIGWALFALRFINFLDAMSKFHDRFSEITAVMKSGKNLPVFLYMTAIIITLGYAACVTDSVYRAGELLTGYRYSNDLSFKILNGTSSVLGSIGMLPLTLHWNVLGMKHCTGNWVEFDENGIAEADKADRYTWMSLVITIPSLLGELGVASAADGEMFGKVLAPLGANASPIIRVALAGTHHFLRSTPPVAGLLRGGHSFFADKLSSKDERRAINEGSMDGRVTTNYSSV